MYIWKTDDPSNPTFSHFTQVVWKSTTQLGCAVSLCDGIFDAKYGKATYHVCMYNPVGNVVGEMQYADLCIWDRVICTHAIDLGLTFKHEFA